MSAPAPEDLSDSEELIRRIPRAFAGAPIDVNAFRLNLSIGERSLSMYRTSLCDPGAVLGRARRPGAVLAWFLTAHLREFCDVRADPSDADAELGHAHAAVTPFGVEAGQQIPFEVRQRLAFLARVTSPGDAS